jgi:TPR repeat protein
MQHKTTRFLTIFAASAIFLIGCRSRPTLHTNANCNLSEQQVADFTSKAQAGDGVAAWRLCEYYGFIKYDNASMLRWMKVAADDGSLAGQYNLAHEYEGAFDSSMRDLDKARYWYQRAADQGDVNAKKKLAELDNK